MTEETQETGTISGFILNDKQIFNDDFMPSKSVKGRWVNFSPNTITNTQIQFTQLAPRNFSDVMKDLRLKTTLNISYQATVAQGQPYIYLKGFNYAIQECSVNINGSLNYNVNPAILAPVYENYNYKYLVHGQENIYCRNDCVLTNRRSSDNGLITDTYSICTPIYHPWLTAPYLGGINNMTLSLTLNLPNLIISAVNDFNPTFTLADTEITYQTYSTNNEVFNIALPYFQHIEAQLNANSNEYQVSIMDLKSAPMKIFITAIDDYRNTTPVIPEQCVFTSARLNLNNIYNAYRSDDLRGLYDIAKYSGYKKSFSEFNNLVMNSETKAGNLDLQLINPSYNVLKNYFCPQCLAFNLRSLDLDIGTNDIFRIDATLHYRNNNINAANTNIIRAKTLCTFYMRYSLFSSSRVQTALIMEDSLANRQLVNIDGYYADYFGFGFFDKLKGGIKNTIKWIKKNKPVSKILNTVAPALTAINPAAGTIASNVGNAANNLGFGTQAF